MDDRREKGRLAGGLWPHESAAETEAELDALMEGLSDVVFVIDVGGRYLKAWSSHPELLIRPAAELVGTTLHERLPADVAEKALAQVRDAVRTGRPVRFDYALSVQVGQRSFSAAIVPMGSERVIWVARDTSESERIFQALRESEERYRAAVELSPDAVLIHVGAAIAFVNQAGLERLGARSRDEIVGRSVLDFVHPDDRAAVGARIQEMLSSSATVPPTQFRFLRVDGTVAYGESAARPLTIGGEPGILVVVRDLTERIEAEAALRETESALRQAQKMEAVGRLAGGIAHDFNNVLTAIGGMAEMMMDAVGPNDPLRTDIVGIRESVDQATNLTRQLLAFSRKQIIQPRLVDLNVIVLGAERLLRRLIGEDIELRFDLASELPPVRADIAQMEQVVVNLAINARDAMPSGGRLHIATARRAEQDAALRRGRTPGDYVVMSVRDVGSGIPADLLPHIFEPFFTTKGPDRGTGLGLATVYAIVQQAGGWIAVDSVAGAGTTFDVFLPAEEGAVEPPAGVDASPRDRGHEVLLLIEDDDRVRALTRRMLTQLGYDVLEAPDGPSGIAVAREHAGRIDLLLTDVVMPHGSGRDVAEAIAAERPGIAVLYMSGYTEDTISHHGVLDQGVMFLQKPFTSAELGRAVRGALGAAAQHG